MATHTKTVRSRVGTYHFPRAVSKIAHSGLAGSLWSHLPVYFEHWPDGRIFISDGLNKPHQWDGFRSQFIPIGLDPPASGTPTIAGSGSGTINGTYRIYVQFVDAEGNLSALSKASADTAVTNVLTLTYANLPIPTDARVIKRRILRNTARQLRTFYVDIETTDIYATSLTSTNTDSTIKTKNSISLTNTDGSDLTGSWDQPRTDKPYMIAHKSRLFAGGEVIYTRGNAQVTFGSDTVTGIGTNWTAQMADRSFNVVGEHQRYTISSVNVANQTLTLTKVYRGATNKFAAYMIRTIPSERANIFYSEANNPEGWPSLNVIKIAEIGEEVTAMIHAESFIYICFRESLYKFSFETDPVNDGSVFLVSHRGCVGQRAWTKLTGSLYVMDHLGIYTLDDSGVAEIAQPIRDLWSIQSPGKWKIDWAHEKMFHAVADTENAIVRFFISLGGYPRHAICYHTLMRQFWIEEYAYPIGASALWQKEKDRVLLAGPGMVLLEHGHGKLDGPNPNGYQAVGTVTAATIMSVTVPSLTLPSSGVVGQPVMIVKGKGLGQVRLIDAFTGSTGKITVTQPWIDQPDTTSVVQVGAVPWKWRSGWFEDLGVSNATVELVFTPSKHPDGADNDAIFRQSAPTNADNFVNIANIKVFADHQDDPEIFVIGRPIAIADWSPLSHDKNADELRVDLTHKSGYAQFHLDQKREHLQNTAGYTSVELSGASGAEEAKIHHVHLGGSKP